jgi:hypothetical protein
VCRRSNFLEGDGNHAEEKHLDGSTRCVPMYVKVL